MTKDQTPSREDIIRMAREAGWIIRDDLHYMDHQAMQDALVERIERFAALVAAAAKAEEREACAKVVEASPSYDWHRFACEAAAAIRARKENT